MSQNTQYKEFSLKEVEKHNTEKDCWIIFNNEVYDLTKFISRHPGGKEIILKFAGKDGTKAFDTKSGRGHAEMAKEFRNKLKIGKIETIPQAKL